MNDAISKLHEFQTALYNKAMAAGLEDDAESHKPNSGFNIHSTAQRLRSVLIEEESDELVDEIEVGTEAGALKEAADLLYVVLGAVVKFGWHDKLVPAFNRVHDDNMRKVAKGEFNKSGKLVKPAGYVKMNLEDLL